MVKEEYKIKDGEEELAYKLRIYNSKDLIGTWEDVANIINDQLGTNFTECRYRKEYKAFKDMFDANKATLMNGNEYANEMLERELSMRKERQRLLDERRSRNTMIRLEARSERFEQLMVDAAKELSNIMPMVSAGKSFEASNDTEAIVFFSDWHYGMNTNNIFNVYNKDVCIKRVNKFVHEAIDRINLHKCSKVHVVLMGDCAHGAIHTSARVESDELVCNQLMQVSELIAEAIQCIWQLTKCTKIEIHSVYGNHMRTVQDKKDNLHADNMERIVPWWLKERFKDISGIEVCDSDKYEFSVVKSFGKNVLCVHGDIDSIKTIGQMTYTLFSKVYGENIDYTVSADKHHMESFSDLGIESSIVGSLCGTDDYANTKRLYSKPSQTVMIFNKNGKDAVYNIVLD